MRGLLALLTILVPCLRATSAADVSRAIRGASLDRDECYRVRELTIEHEDIKFYLTDGFLLFSKPVAGEPISAVFSADVEGGDAEVMVLPPNRGERLSLSAFTQSPNLNDHFKAVVMIFTDDTAHKLKEQIERGAMPKSPEKGALLAAKWNPVLENLYSSIEIRLVVDLLGANRETGVFYAFIAGSPHGNFDVVYDPLAAQQINVGQVAFGVNRAVFNTWTSFPARRHRTGAKPDPFRLSNYSIDANIEANLNLKIVTRVELEPLRKSGRVLGFDLSRRMHVTEARIDGQPVEVFQRDSLRANLNHDGDNDLFILVAPEELTPGRKYALEFHHEGAVISAAGNGVYFVGSRVNWYPHRGQDFAKYELTFRYPATLGLIATGDVVSDKTEGEWRVTTRKTAAPIRFAGFNLGDYESVNLSRDGYKVEVYANRFVETALEKTHSLAAAPNPVANLQALASDVASTLSFMAEKFGPLPIKSLAVSPIPGAFGQGFPGLIYLSTLSYIGAKERPHEARDKFHQIFFSELLMPHELAHQWWGNLVQPADYQSEWLMESLANYSALMLLENRKGPRALETVLDGYRAHLLAKDAAGRSVESSGPIVWGFRLNSLQSPDAWRAITYEKGSWIIHMLRQRLGDEQFLRMLSELIRRYRDQTLNTEQFRELVAGFVPPKSPDPKLEIFFENWVYGTGVPVLKLNYTVRGKAPVWKIEGTVTQEEADEFSMDVPLEIQFGKGKSLVHWVRTSDEQASVSITVKQQPVRVSLPPTSSLLYIKK